MSTVIVENKPSPHRITVDEYHRMAEVGLLAPDARVELIEGEIIDMAPIGKSHRAVVARFNRLLSRATGDHAILLVQDSLRLSMSSEPQPDLVLLKPREDFYSTRHPDPADTLLLIEVSDSTSRYDRKVKVPLYARHGVPEVWIVDLESGHLRFFRSWANGLYTDISITDKPEVTPLPGLDGLSVDLSGVLEI